ncbi:MAG TPA: hypothetical protein ENK22_00785 [Persephonella sp.]|nr:hypothetical protein [Persephonella sp.]
MMKRFFIYTFIFITAFLITFVMTFPIGNLTAYLLSKYGFYYSRIEGNLFHVTINNLEKGNILIKKVEMKNYIYKQKISINESLQIYLYPLSKAADLICFSFEISAVQEKPQVYGKLTGKYKLNLKNKVIIISGEGNLKEFKTVFFPIYLYEVRHRLEPNIEKNSVYADITGKDLNGKFNGILYLPVNIKDGYIKGKFSGKFMNLGISEDIYIQFNRYIIDGESKIKF